MPILEIQLDPVPGCDSMAEIRRELQARPIERIEVCGSVARVILSEDRGFSKVLNESLIDHINFEETVHHSAALHSWLRSSRTSRSLVVIHVDTHNDLGSPNLICAGDGAVYDRWTRHYVRPSDLDSVRSAIDSSAIEIGSFLTAAIAWLPIAAIIWISPSIQTATLWGTRSKRSFVRIERNTTDRLNKTLLRLSAQPGRNESDSVPLHVSIDGERLENIIRPYRANSDFIVGIDFDYFDCSLENGGSTLDSSGGEGIGSRAFDLFIRLLRSLPRDRIVCITAAHSPGFCVHSIAMQCSEDLKRAVGATICRTFHDVSRRD